MKEYDVQIAFTIWDFGADPADVTSRLGITPLDAKRKGERNAKLVLPKCNLWVIESYAPDRRASVAQHWQSIRILETKIAIINHVRRPGVAKFTIVVDGTERIPEIVVPPALSAFAASVDAEIDIDIYE